MLMMMALVEEERVREGKKLLEMLWKMGEGRRCLNKTDSVCVVRVLSWGAVGCSIFSIEMDWIEALNKDMKMLREKQRLRPKCTCERE